VKGFIRRRVQKRAEQFTNQNFQEKIFKRRKSLTEYTDNNVFISNCIQHSSKKGQISSPY